MWENYSLYNLSVFSFIYLYKQVILIVVTTSVHFGSTMLNIHILVEHDITFQEYIVTTSHFIKTCDWFFVVPSYLRLLDPVGMPELAQRYFQFCISPKDTCTAFETSALSLYGLRFLFDYILLLLNF